MHAGRGDNPGRGKADFEKAWAVFLSQRTEADFQEWRDQQEWTERK
jgi:hypothetical protein